MGQLLDVVREVLAGDLVGPQLAAEAGLEFLTPIIEVSYGKWAWINRTLLTVLRFFYGIFGNWGVAVIVLTLLVLPAIYRLAHARET